MYFDPINLSCSTKDSSSYNIHILTVVSIIDILLITDNEIWMNSAQYLFKFKRGVEAIQGDGNCLFRALSRILCGNEDNHSFIRRTLVTFGTHNKSWL